MPPEIIYPQDPEVRPFAVREQDIEAEFIEKLKELRPYQIYAVQAIVDCIEQNNGNGYIWHTTGSGKPLTSFTVSSLLKLNEHIHKCPFVVDRKVALPGQLFYSTQIPVCLWFLAKNKAADVKRGFRDRRKQTLFIDARKLGTFPTQVEHHEYQHRLAA